MKVQLLKGRHTKTTEYEIMSIMLIFNNELYFITKCFFTVLGILTRLNCWTREGKHKILAALNKSKEIFFMQERSQSLLGIFLKLLGLFAVLPLCLLDFSFGVLFFFDLVELVEFFGCGHCSHHRISQLGN